jgi:urease accessory protein
VLAPAPLDNFVADTGFAAGVGRVRVSRGGTSSVVARLRAESPLKLLTPANHGCAAWIFTSTYGGGLVDGDAIALDLEVDRGASALVSSQASTKVYRSARGTSMTLDARVGAGGLLVVLPDPVVCYAGARFRQAQRIDLESDASVVCLDWMTSGRRAHGERWAFVDYHSRLFVRHDGRPICRDAVRIAAEDGDLADRFGRFDVLATLVLIGPACREASRALVAHVAAAPVARHADRLIAASALGDLGAIVRVAGRSAEAVGRAVRDSLAFLPSVLGDDPWTRKW